MKNHNEKINQILANLKIDIGLQILELRIIKNYTQKQLAKIIGTQQPGIARIERGATIPTLGLLTRIAAALGTELMPPKFAVVEDNEDKYKAKSINTNNNQNGLIISATKSNWEKSIPSYGITSESTLQLV